jgi:hypothetical protein
VSVQAITLQHKGCEFAVSHSAATSDYDKPAFSSTDRRRILAGQFRLLAARLDHRLPIDRRSIKNALRLCFELLREQAA